MWLAFTVIVIVVSIIPVIGGMIVGVATPLLIGGVMIAARGADREGVVRFGDLFAGFSNRAGTLLLIGLLQLIISMVIGILFGIATAAYIGGTLGPGIAQMTAQQILTWQVMGPMLIVGALFAVVFVPLTNAVWLASCLAALHDMGALDALRKAFSATLRNLLPLLVWVLVGLLLAIVATVPLALGWFVVGPVFLCAIYAQYRDLFAATDKGA